MSHYHASFTNPPGIFCTTCMGSFGHNPFIGAIDGTSVSPARDQQAFLRLLQGLSQRPNLSAISFNFIN